MSRDLFVFQGQGLNIKGKCMGRSPKKLNVPMKSPPIN